MILPMLEVKNYDDSVKFYTEKLGFTSVMSMKGPDGQNIFGFVALGGSQIGLGHDPKPNVTLSKDRGNGVVLMIYPDDFDIDAYCEKVKANGVPLVEELKTEYWGDRVFSVKDPDGFYLTFGKTVQTVPPDEIQAHMSQQPQP